MHEKKLINSNGIENGEGHLSFRCFICPLSYTSRLVCINHMEDKHSSDWLQLKETYKVDDIEEFSKQMDTMAETLPKMILDKSSGIKYLIGTMAAESSDIGTSFPNSQTAIFTFSGTTEKLNCCALCPKRFFWETELRRHTDVHLGKYNLSLVVRKPVFGVSDQVGQKAGYATTEDGSLTSQPLK